MVDLLTIGGSEIGRLTLQPGWRWSEHVKPIAGTDLCEAPHFQYHVQGTLRIRMADGTELDARAGRRHRAPGGSRRLGRRRRAGRRRRLVGRVQLREALSNGAADSPRPLLACPDPTSGSGHAAGGTVSDVSGEGPPPPSGGAVPSSAPSPVRVARPGAPPAWDVVGPYTPGGGAAARAAAATGAKGKPRSRIPSVAATTAVTAIITAIVGGVLSQDRIDSVFGDDEASESASAEVEPEYKHVTESARAIAVDVPESWGAVDAMFSGIGGVTSPGLGLRAGPDPMAVVFASDETVWVGASTQAFDDLGLDALDDKGVVDLFEGRLEGSVYLPAQGSPHLGGTRARPRRELGRRGQGVAGLLASIEGWRRSRPR